MARLRRAMRDAQVRGEVAGPGKFFSAQVASMLDTKWPVHLHVPIEAASCCKGAVARAAEGHCLPARWHNTSEPQPPPQVSLCTKDPEVDECTLVSGH